MKNTVYDRAEDYDDQYSDYTKDISFWEWLANQYAGKKPILEFACGTGRVTLALGSRRHIVGVDISEEMLKVCKQKLSASNMQNVVLHHGDMCTFKTGEKHDLVFVPFNSFLHVVGFENQLMALKNFHSHLEDDGHLVVDIFNPSILHLARGLNLFSTQSFEKRLMLPDGNILVRSQTTKYFSVTQQTEWVFYIEIYDGDTNEMVRKYTEEATVQMIFPNEWRMLLKTAGFEIVEEYGDFERNPFIDNSRHMLFVCKKV